MTKTYTQKITSYTQGYALNLGINKEDGLKANKRWATPKQMEEIYKGIFTVNSIRWLIFNEKTNGFGRCIRRIVGKKIVIDLDEFESWVDEQR